MSNKNNDPEPITVEKFCSSYPHITLVSDNSVKTVETASNDCPQQAVTVTQAKVSVTSSPTTKVSTTNIVKTSPTPVADRKVPPYVINAIPHDPLRVSKPVPPKTPPKVLPKLTQEKVSVTVEVTVPNPSSGNNKSTGEIAKSPNSQPVRTSLALSTPTKPVANVDKVAVSTTPTTESNKPSIVGDNQNKNAEKTPSRPTQITCKTSDVFEKNLQSKILTVTPTSKSPSLIKATPTKDTKSTETTNVTVPKTFSPSPTTPKITPAKTPILSTESLCKNISKSVSLQTIENSPKQVTTCRIFPASNPKSNSKSVVVSEATKPKIMIVTSTESSVKTKPSPTSASSPSPKIQTYESFVVPSVPTTVSNNKNVTLKLNQSSGNLQLNSLSELQNNKDLREALNSGSTARLGENVTISSAPVEYVVLHPVNTKSTDQKIRNVSSETTIEKITAKQASNPSSPVQKKNGNSIEGAGQSKDSNPNSSNPSPNESRNTKRVEIPGLINDDEEEEEEEEEYFTEIVNSKKKIDEPVEYLTISSDEETESEQFVPSGNNELSVSILNKEPPLDGDEESAGRSIGDDLGIQKEIDSMLEANSGDGYTNLICRTVRIGSYKVRPKSGVTLSKYGIKIVVPPLNNPNDNVALKIPIHDITKVLVHYNRSLPVIFYYITPQAGAKIRHKLRMNDSSYFYFDPKSADESHRRITLLPEKFSDDDKLEISNFYLNRDVLDELTHSEANQLLVQSAPKDIQKAVRLPPNPVQTIMVFPPPPAKGGISINTEDYSCLAEDVYLNDVIIDFYLKYLFYEKLDEEDRQKTHIFSSFFYKRLTDKATPVPKILQNSKSGDSTVTAAEIRHSRVKNWTKNIDIFSKDYIVIPLNENQHWFLAIICFPGLKGPVRFSDNTPIDLDSSKNAAAGSAMDDLQNENSFSSDKEADSKCRSIGSTTITPLRVENSFSLADDDDDMEDRDEADGADEDVDNYTSSEGSIEESYSDSEYAEAAAEGLIPKRKLEREPIKQPCILIFDSLKSASRARIIATLREYLHVEYKVKHNGEERDFSKNVVKGACPKVPQQTNYTDCGLYVLQYVETFFEKKVTDFHVPIKTLSQWFPSHIVSYKRYDIQQLLLRLMEEQNINVNALHLPELNLSPQNSFCESDIEDYGDDDGEYYEEGELEHGEYDDMDEMEEHEARMRENIMEGYIDEEDDDEELIGESRYAMYDSDPQSPSDEDLNDDVHYRDLEEFDMSRMTHRTRRTMISVTSRNDDNEEILHEEEEDDDDMMEEEEEEIVEHESINDRINNLNNENVTISRMSTSAGTENNQGNDSRNSLAELKAARPWKKFNEVSLENASEEDCPNKKFKSN